MKRLHAFAILPAFVADPACAEVQLESKLEEYDVTGTILEEVDRNIFAVSPVEEDGETYAGQGGTRWNWWVTTVMSGGNCRIDTVRIDAVSTITLPRWIGYETAREADQAEWDRYITALRGHEKGHTDRGEAQLARLEEALRSLRPALDCDMLIDDARSMADRFNASIQMEQSLYDDMTNHGVTQGAALRYRRKP